MRVLLLTLVLATPADAGRVESLVELAELYVEAGRATDALAVYAKLRALQPRVARWWRDAVPLVPPARRLRLLAGWHRALPRDDEAARRLMYERERRGRYAGAERLVDQLLRRRPDDLELLRQRAQLVARRGGRVEARAAWDAVVRHVDATGADVEAHAAVAPVVVRAEVPRVAEPAEAVPDTVQAEVVVEEPAPEADETGALRRRVDFGARVRGLRAEGDL